MLRQAMSPFIIYLFLTAYSLKCYECKPHGKCEGNSKGEPDTVCQLTLTGLMTLPVEPACVKAISNGTTWRKCIFRKKGGHLDTMGLKKDECNIGNYKIPDQEKSKYPGLPESFGTVCLCSTDNCNGSGMIRSKSAAWLAGIIATYILK